MTDIVERLRKIIRICGEAQETKWIVDDVDEAITHLLTSGAKNIALTTEIRQLRQLRADNARLRGALVDMLNGIEAIVYDADDDEVDALDIDELIGIARRALSDAPQSDGCECCNVSPMMDTPHYVLSDTGQKVSLEGGEG